jgi:hypothetical protein
MKNLIKTALLTVLVLSLISVKAQATFIDVVFQRITNNNVENIASQLGLKIYDATQANTTFSSLSLSGNQVLFAYTNNVGITSSISEVYLDDGTDVVVNLVSVEDSLSGYTDFSGGSANPGNLPSGENLSPSFEAIEQFSADAQGHPSKGIDEAADILGIIYDTSGGISGIENAIGSGELRIGLHVRATGIAEDSDSFINTNPSCEGSGENVTPEPSAIILFGIGLLGLAGIMVRRKMKK